MNRGSSLKRVPFKSKALRIASPKATASVEPKTKLCAAPKCGRAFLPKYNTTQIVCSLQCAKRLAKVIRAAKEAEEKASFKARQEAAKPRNVLKKAAQDAFNAFIRARDAAEGCISCETLNPPMRPGGQWDAGHFLGRGAYPELAFEESNCQKQCKSCNAGGGKFGHKERTVNEKYEAGLRKRIGDERVDWLKGPHEPKHYTADDFRAIAATYKAKLKELVKQREEIPA